MIVVKVINDPKLSLTSKLLVASVNYMCSSSFNKLLAVQTSQSDSILVIPNNEKLKHLMDQKASLTKVIPRGAKVKCPLVTVTAYAIQTNKLGTAKEEIALANLHAHNLEPVGNVKLLTDS